MGIKTKAELAAFFETGDKPTESQFIDFIDSYVDKSGPIGSLETAASGDATGVTVFTTGSAAVHSYDNFREIDLGITVYTTALASAVAVEVINEIYATTSQAESGNETGLLMNPILTKAAINSLSPSNTYATTAQAISGVSANVNMDPVLTRNAIQTFAFTTAAYSTTAQANAGTDATTIMNPVLVKNAISALSSSPLAATQAQQEAGSLTTVYTSPGQQQSHPSATKFWADISHSSTTPTLTTSYNVTSITDTATGELTVTIATDFSSANWCCLVSIESNDAIMNPQATACISFIDTKAAGSCLINFYNLNDVSVSLDLEDPSDGWQVAGFGDQ